VKRTILVLEVSTVLLLAAIGSSFAHVWKSGPLTFELGSVALIIPAMTTVLFLCVSIGVPDLYAVDRLRFPLNFTLPAIHTAMLLLSTTLVSRVGLSISRVPDNFTVVNVWSEPRVLAVTFVAGVLCLSVLGLLDRDREKVNEGNRTISDER
jgi:hypothetical protein